MRYDFSAAQDPAAVARICQLVAGMPLALELAAAWAKTLTCALKLPLKFRGGLTFSAPGCTTSPTRHRSIQTIFDHTCQQLSEDERAAFARLSVFRGGFDRAAATAVAGASLPQLSLFLDKSLLSWSPEGRYHIHELLRQYAAEHLAESSADLSQVQDLHCTYYTHFLDKVWSFEGGRDQFAAAAATETELKNIRAAWQWAVQQGKPAEITMAAKPLANVHQCQSRYAEALNTFEQRRGTVTPPGRPGIVWFGLDPMFNDPELLLFTIRPRR